MTTLSRLVRIIVLLGLTAGLAGCSAIKLGYNQLDHVAYWWLDGYLAFTDEQSPGVRQELARLHLWHRKHELPALSGLLHDMEALAPSDISPAQACAFVDRARERLSRLAEQAEPAVVALAMDLKPEQLVHLERKYERNSAKFRRDWLSLSPQESADKRLAQFEDRIEMVYGSLDSPQLAVLRQHLQRSIFDAKRILAERQRRQEDALHTLRQVSASGMAIIDARRLMRGWLERIQSSARPLPSRTAPPWGAANNVGVGAQSNGYQQALFQEACQTVAALHNSTNAAQREGAARRLRAYQRDLSDLAAQP